MMRVLCLVVLLLAAASAATAGNWPAWRGPLGNGYSDETGLPLTWSATENVRWKTPLPGPGNSTPIIWGDRVFLTQSLDRGGRQRAVICLDRRTGKILWQQSITFDGEETTHADNPYGSASPVTDGERVIAWFGSAGAVCYDFEGKELWRRDLGRFEHIWGNASSPLLYRDLAIFNCGPGERTFLLAVDKQTGKDVWKVEIPGGSFGEKSTDWSGSWSTPVLVRVKGRDELLLSWPEAVRAYDPRTGRDLWSCQGLTKLVYTSPVATPEVVVAMSGYGGSALAVRPGGSGDVTATHRLWREPRSPQRIGSGVIIGDYFYVVNAPGTAECIEWKTGKSLWTERIGFASWGNLVYAAGRLYVTTKQGETVVMAASPKFEILARSPLAEPTLASIAVSQGDLFIRTYNHLWCIQSPAK